MVAVAVCLAGPMSWAAAHRGKIAPTLVNPGQTVVIPENVIDPASAPRNVCETGGQIHEMREHAGSYSARCGEDPRLVTFVCKNAGAVVRVPNRTQLYCP